MPSTIAVRLQLSPGAAPEPAPSHQPGEWSDKKQKLHHYDVALQHPSTLGCFHRTPINTPVPGEARRP